MPPEPGTLTGRTVAAVVITWESAVPDGRRRVAAVGRRVAALCAAGVDVAVISQATAARLSWPLWSQPLGAGHLLLSVSYGSELFEAGSGGLRLLCRRTGRSGRPDAMRDILGVLAGQGIGLGGGAVQDDAALLVTAVAAALHGWSLCAGRPAAWARVIRPAISAHVSGSYPDSQSKTL